LTRTNLFFRGKKGKFATGNTENAWFVGDWDILCCIGIRF